MMPTREFGQNRADAESFVGIPDGTATSGIKLLSGNYVGPSAAGYDWEAGPCS